MERDASLKEITAAFQQKVVELHPKNNPTPQGEEEFNRLLDAYEVLRNEEKRHLYDHQWWQGQRHHEKPPQKATSPIETQAGVEQPTTGQAAGNRKEESLKESQLKEKTQPESRAKEKNHPIQRFLAKKDIEFSVKRYLIDAMGFMALGLFGTLLIGSILSQIGNYANIPYLSETIWPAARSMTGVGIAIAVAYGLKAPPLVLFSITTAGFLGNTLGGPVGAFLAAVVGTEFGKLVSKETKVDILVTPAVTILVGSLVATLAGPPVSALMTGFGAIISEATTLSPIPMGIVVSVLVGIALTLPISSAALCVMLWGALEGGPGIVAGAATVGCCCQMVGFAVQSYSDNDLGRSFAQGVGTSMIQIPNIVKNWKIWIPPTLAAAILGPFATTFFAMENTALGAGMGTSGFVGQLGTLSAMAGSDPVRMWAGIILLHFVGPAIITLIGYKVLRSIGWIKPGDLHLEV